MFSINNKKTTTQILKPLNNDHPSHMAEEIPRKWPLHVPYHACMFGILYERNYFYYVLNYYIGFRWTDKFILLVQLI
jgi:hypothetical protein